ncbi:MAG: DUF3488 domain-containing protein [Phycisphaerales bacterium]|nr:DUF3488 domain-containing protein [Phycisphaerales bacterium]
MKLLRRFPLMAFTLVLLSILGICVGLKSVGLLLVAGPLAAMSWYVTEGPRGRHLPRWAANVLTIGACLNVFIDLLGSEQEVIGVLGRFIVWLTLIKLYEPKTPKDYGNLLALSLLLMMTGCLATVDLLFGILLIVYAALGLYVLLLFQLHAGFELAKRRRTETVPADYRLAPPLRPLFGRSAAGHFAVSVAVVAVVGLSLAVMIFIVTPRGSGHGFLNRLRRDRDQSVTAFVDSVNLQTGTRITSSRRPVMTVRIVDAANEPVHLNQPLMLRGATLEQYRSGGRWASNDPHPRTIRTDEDVLTSLAADAVDTGPGLEVNVTFIQPSRTLFAPYAPTAIATRTPTVLEYDPPSQTLRFGDVERLNAYRVRWNPTPSDGLAAALTDGPISTRPVAGGQYRNDRVRAMATQILEAARTPVDSPAALQNDAYWQWTRQAAQAFMRRLQGGSYGYTTDLSDVPPAPASQDPVERFLAETKRGHCEYFASGLAALCQSVNVPVRIVTGYMTQEYDDTDQTYIVREANAHAWVEVQTGPSRWTTFDPSPPTILADQESTDGLADRLRWFYDRLEMNWSTNIVAFDGSTQTQMMDRLDLRWSDQLATFMARVRQWAGAVNRAFYFGWAGYAWMVLVGFILALSIGVLVRLVRRRRRIHRVLQLHHVTGAEYRRILGQVGFYLDMLGVLRRAGYAKPDWSPPRLHAASIAPRIPAAAPTVERLIDAFYAVRFGGRSLDRDEARTMERLVIELEQQLQRPEAA